MLFSKFNFSFIREVYGQGGQNATGLGRKLTRQKVLLGVSCTACVADDWQD